MLATMSLNGWTTRISHTTNETKASLCTPIILTYTYRFTYVYIHSHTTILNKYEIPLLRSKKKHTHLPKTPQNPMLQNTTRSHHHYKRLNIFVSFSHFLLAPLLSSPWAFELQIPPPPLLFHCNFSLPSPKNPLRLACLSSEISLSSVVLCGVIEREREMLSGVVLCCVSLFGRVLCAVFLRAARTVRLPVLLLPQIPKTASSFLSLTPVNFHLLRQFFKPNYYCVYIYHTTIFIEIAVILLTALIATCDVPLIMTM